MAAEQLAHYYRRNGYTRLQNPARRETENQSYKKGDELRLVAQSRAELTHIRQLLRHLGFVPGRPFAKGRQFRQPVYGREAVRRFFALILNAQSAHAPGAPSARR